MTQIKKYTKKDGTTAYMFNVYVGKNSKGKNVYRKRQGFKTKKQAQIALANLLKDVEENGVERDESVKTFKDLYEMWLVQHRLNVKPSTMEWIKRTTNKHILPSLANCNIEELSVIQCQELVNRWYSQDLAINKRLRSLTAQIIQYGISMELLKTNSMKQTITPRKKPKEKRLQFYTKEQLAQFFECVKKDGDYKILTFFRMLAFTGARKSELLALQWEDIDFRDKKLIIRKTLAIDENKRIIVQTPKTASSNRTISLDDETLKILAKWRAMQRTDYLALGFNTSSEKQFIFTTDDNKLINPLNINSWLTSIINRYKLPTITPHHFRHTHASLLLQAGIPIKEVSERLGHTDIKLTLEIYSHVMPEEAEKTANKFANFVGF